MRFDLFLISFLTLFLELACIRWFPSHVLFLTFFTNTVLLACFLGMSVGCLAANSQAQLPAVDAAPAGHRPCQRPSGRVAAADLEQHHRRRQPGVAADGLLRRRVPGARRVDLRHSDRGALRLLLPGDRPGDGRARPAAGAGARASCPTGCEAYTIDIVGSIVGIVAVRRLLAPGAVAALVVWPGRWPAWPISSCRRRTAAGLALGLAVASALVLVLAIAPVADRRSRSRGSSGRRTTASTTSRRPRLINVNLIGHQQMQSRESPFPAYALPHLLNRDAGRTPFERRADHRRRLGQRRQPGAGLGRGTRRRRRDRSGHPAARQAAIIPIGPTTTRASSVHLNDGRNFLQSTDQAVRPDRLRAGRLAGAAQQLQQHPPRELPVHEAGDGRRQEAAQAGRRVRDVQLLPPGLDRVAPAELGASRIRRGGAGPESAEPRSRWSPTTTSAATSPC